MSWRRVVLGFIVSMIGGHLVIQPLVHWMWWYISKHNDLPREHTKKSGMLSMPIGLLERGLYTLALISGMWQLIGAWFVLKVPAKWKALDNFRGAGNVWLIGSGLSLLFGFLGAWIALGHMPIIR